MFCFEAIVGMAYLFHLQEVPTLKLVVISCHNFSAHNPKRYCKDSLCGPYEAKHPKRMQNCFFSTTNRCDKQLHPFNMGVPPPGGNSIFKVREFVLEMCTAWRLKNIAFHFACLPFLNSKSTIFCCFDLVPNYSAYSYHHHHRSFSRHWTHIFL